MAVEGAQSIDTTSEGDDPLVDRLISDSTGLSFVALELKFIGEGLTGVVESFRKEVIDSIELTPEQKRNVEAKLETIERYVERLKKETDTVSSASSSISRASIECMFKSLPQPQ